jgi:hypothetical protein
MTVEHQHTNDGGSSNSTAIVAIFAILIVAVAVWFFTLGPGAGTTTPPSDGGTVPLPSVAAPLSSP